MSVGANTFTIAVTAQDNITAESYTIVVTRDTAPSTGTYALSFDEEFYELMLENYPDEEYYNPSIILSATASGTDGQGNPLTADIVYTNGFTTNTTGEFYAMGLLWDSGYITATATFSDGTVIETSVEVFVCIIAPENSAASDQRDF